MKISKEFLNKFGKFCLYNFAAAFIVCYYLYSVATGELDAQTLSQILVHPVLFFSGILLTNLIMIAVPFVAFFITCFIVRLIVKLKSKRK